MTVNKAKRILIAEDDDGDIALMKIALRGSGWAEEIAFVRNGEEALEYLYGLGGHSGRPKGQPELIMLDMKLPKVSGLEVLRRVREDERWGGVPVVIFSSSLDEKDREKSLTAGANDFLIKPMDFDSFSEAVRGVIASYLN